MRSKGMNELIYLFRSEFLRDVHIFEIYEYDEPAMQ